MKRWGVRGGARFAAAALAAIAGLTVVATRASAATVDLTQNPPTGTVQLAVGDVINMTLPPVIWDVPSGYTQESPDSYPMPTSSDPAVLARVSGTTDSGGTVHAQFRAEAAGRATLSYNAPAGIFCAASTTSTTTTATTSATSSLAPASAQTAMATSMSATTTTTSTTATANSSPTPAECTVVDPVLHAVTVIVSAVGVQGAAVSVPATGSGGIAGAGVWLVAAGAVVGVAGGARVLAVRRRR